MPFTATAGATAAGLTTGQAFAANVALTTIVAGAGISAVGAIQQGRALETQAEQQQALLDRNAELARRQGVTEQQAANEAALELQRRGRRALSKRAIEKTGLLGRGSVLVVAEEEASIIEQDILQLRKEGRVSREFRESEAVGLELSGEAAILRGLATKKASRFKAVGGILTGVGRAAELSS